MFSQTSDNKINGDLGQSYEEIDDDFFDPQAMESQNSKNMTASDKQKMSTSSPKKVQFDDQVAPKADNARNQQAAPASSVTKQVKVIGQSSAAKRVSEVLDSLEQAIDKHYNAGHSEKRNMVLVEYCQTANEAAQNLNLHDENDQKSAMKILEKCTKVIDKNSNKLNPFSELYYETFNNMARCANIQGDIQQSLLYLVHAMHHVKELSKEQEPGSVTIIPELSLNICNANIYLKDYQTALQYAEQAVVSSKQCVNSLERKLDMLGSQGNASVSEQQRLSQLYLSQLNLNIQGYQAKGQAYEKIKAYNDAIREYNKAKQVVEQNFGTTSKMFIELVNQISAANVNLKTANYSGRSEGSVVFSNPGGQSIGSKGRAGRGLKKKEKKEEKKKPSPEQKKDNTVQSKGSSIDIRSDMKDSQDFERVSKMSQKSIQTQKAPETGGLIKGSLIFDGDDTGSNKQRVHHAVSAQKRRRIRQTIDREQQKANKLLKQSPNHISRNGPARPFSAVTSDDQPNLLIQPPWNKGGNTKVGCFFNKNTRYCLASTKDLWKVDHQIHPQMLGDVGFSTMNPERPKRLYYYGGGRFPRQKSRSRSTSARKKVVLRSSTVLNTSQNTTNQDSQLYEELQKMRNQIKQREMTEIEDRIKLVQQQQMDQQKNVLYALEQQKLMMIENHQKERDRARLERESLLSKQSTCHESPHHHGGHSHHGSHSHQNQNDCHFQQSNQGNQYGQQAPPIHPQYGPAVFDYNYGCWTYPYAQWYGGQQQYQQEEESPEEDHYVPSPPERHEISIQKDFDVVPKPEVHIMATQTPSEAKKVTMDFAIQTQNFEVQHTGTSPLKIQTKIPEKQPPKPKARYTKNQAARIIAKKLKQRVIQKREAAYRYRDVDGVLLTKKWRHNKISGGSEILSLYAVPGPDGRCLCLRFTIFDYASKQFIFVGVYEELKHLQEFDAHILCELSKSSLDAIVFEKSPFRYHILCLQSIINSYRIANKPQEQIRLAQEAKKKPQKEPEILYVDKVKPTMVETFTQMDENIEEVVEEQQPIILIQNQVQGNSLKKPKVKVGKTKLEHIIHIQSKIRALIARKYFKIQQRIKQQAREKAEALWQSEKVNGVHKESTSRPAETKVLYSLRKKVQCDAGCGRRFYTIRLVKQINEKGEYRYEIKAKESNKKNAIETTWKIHNGLRLPQPEDDPSNNPLLSYYMNVATILEMKHEAGENQKCELSCVRLMRVKLQIQHCNFQITPPPPNVDEIDFRIGCIVKKEFPLHNYPNHWCKVYKRIRMEDPNDKKNKKKVHDWKVKVTQLDGAQSWDYMVVRRLPCPLENIEQHIQDNLGIQFNKRIIPSIILHLFWDIKVLRKKQIEEITIFSQTYHDLASSRFNTNFLRNHYMSQNLETQRRVVTRQQVLDKDWDPLYELYIQELVPKTTDCLPYRYNTEAYQARKASIVQKKRQRFGEVGAIIDADSSSEDESDPTKYQNNECFWDIDQLEKMQLDEITIKRSFIKLTCQKTTNKQDHDHFRVEKEIAKWANPEVEYQYLMECLALKQIQDPVSGETTIDFVGLNIRADEARFKSDVNWNNYLRSNRFTESFMAQDLQRWKNQNFIVSVYNMKQYGGEIIFEAINVDKPHQRAYITDTDTLKGMRGKILLYYIDQALKIYGEGEGPTYNKEKSDQFGFTGVINTIQFLCSPDNFRRRMLKNSEYCDWTYEKSDDELEIKETVYAPSVIHIDPVQRSNEIKKKQEEDRIRAEQLKKNVVSSIVKRQTEHTFDDKRRAAIVMQKWMKMAIQKRRFRMKQKKFEVMAKFSIQLSISKVKNADLYIMIYKYENPVHFKYVIMNMQNREKNDDILSIKAMKLPGGLSVNETDISKFINVFRQKLKIIWYAPNDKGITRIQDGFIDNTVVREEIIHKIVEVKIHEERHKHRKSKKDGPDDLYCQDRAPEIVQPPPPQKPVDGDSDETEISVTEDEMIKIKMDIKDIKTILKLIKKKTLKLEVGIRGWFLQFDRDNSDKIELNEFVDMVRFLNIEISDRLGIMLFRLFDRQNQGFFSYAEFLDIIEKRMRPSYKKYVRAERERYDREGLNITYPKKRAPQIVYKEKIKEVEKIVMQDKIVYVDKPVDRIVEKIVEKPIYIQHDSQQKEKIIYVEKPVEKIVYVEREKGQQQPQIQIQEKIVYVDRIVEVAATQPIQPNMPVQPIEPAQPQTWEDEDNRNKELKQEQIGVFNINDCTMMYEVFSGLDKDYYLTTSIKAQNQNFGLYKKVLIGDKYEETARQRLRQQNNSNPTKKVLAGELKIMIEKELKEMSNEIINPKKQPETWIPNLKERIKMAFYQ